MARVRPIELLRGKRIKCSAKRLFSFILSCFYRAYSPVVAVYAYGSGFAFRYSAYVLVAWEFIDVVAFKAKGELNVLFLVGKVEGYQAEVLLFVAVEYYYTVVL